MADSKRFSVASDDDGIDPSLRERVMEEIGIFTDALEAASANPTDEALDDLRKASDNLMRAVGRVLIEIAHQRGQQERDC
jgi:hypothetical protein